VKEFAKTLPQQTHQKRQRSPTKAESTPKPALKKREDKASKKLAVKFNENVEVHTFWQRNWNDYKKKDMIRGPFTEVEVQKLVTALCEYANQ
jgi:hypothetical protein